MVYCRVYPKRWYPANVAVTKMTSSAAPSFLPAFSCFAWLTLVIVPIWWHLEKTPWTVHALGLPAKHCTMNRSQPDQGPWAKTAHVYSCVPGPGWLLGRHATWRQHHSEVWDAQSVSAWKSPKLGSFTVCCIFGVLNFWDVPILYIYICIKKRWTSYLYLSIDRSIYLSIYLSNVLYCNVMYCNVM